MSPLFYYSCYYYYYGDWGYWGFGGFQVYALGFFVIYIGSLIGYFYGFQVAYCFCCCFSFFCYFLLNPDFLSILLSNVNQCYQNVDQLLNISIQDPIMNQITHNNNKVPNNKISQNKLTFAISQNIQNPTSFAIVTKMSDPYDPHSSYYMSIQLILIGLATISSIVSLFIPALYHIKKQCRQHPTSLISKISLLQALSNYNIILIAVNIYKFESYINITNIFDIITFNQPEEPTDTEFCQINYILYMILELSSIAYNIAFSVDLFVTVKFPFYAGKKRMKFYNIFAVLFLASTLPEAAIQANDICQNQYHNRAIYKVPIIFIFVLGVFYAISSFIIVYSFYHARKIGPVRAKYIKHHRIILWILLGAWFLPLWTNILIYQGDQTSDLFYIVNLGSFVTLLLLGAIVNMVRFYHDKVLWERVKRMLMFKKTIKKKKNPDEIQPIESDIWNLPLAAAVAQLNNQKIVHSLIQVVTHACLQGQIQKIKRYQNQKTSRSKSISHFTARQKEIIDKFRAEDSILQNKAQLHQRFIQRNIENATLIELKKISKKIKKFNMFCLNDDPNSNHEQAHLQLKEKTVFTKEKLKKTSSQQNKTQQKPRATSLNKNHMSLIHQKDISRLKNQFTFNQNAKSIDYSKMETYFQSNSDVHRQRKDNIQIKVVSHAHHIFSSIRKLNGLDSESILQSLNLESNIENILKAKQSLGASGSFFFFSFDHKLIIKTIAQGQDAILLDILPQYYIHLKKYKDTLFSKIYGLYSVQIAGVSKITFILMENSFNRMQKQNIVFKKYDLKGSTVSREVKNPNADVLKDMNYLKSNDAFIMMDPQDRQQLIKQLQADIRLLRARNIMDYSLLVGVGVKSKPLSEPPSNIQFQDKQNMQRQIDTQKQNQINFQRDILKRKRQYLEQQKKTARKYSNKMEYNQKSWKYIDEYEDISGRIYSISIIDYLQEFNFNKYMELQLKKIFKGGGDISSVDSEFYFERFLNFVKKIIIPVTNFNKPKQKPNNNQIHKNSIIVQAPRKTAYRIKINDDWEELYLKQV